MPAKEPFSDAFALLHGMLEPFGQAHLLRDWTQLNDEQRGRLTAQIYDLDLPLLNRLFEAHDVGASVTDSDIEPAPIVSLPKDFDDWAQRESAGEVGEELLAAGKVAVVLVAGGQGSRLGFDGPKGAFPIGPVSGHCLFQLFAEQVVALTRRFERPLPLLIMTSTENDLTTRALFERQRYFGLSPDQVTFFQQRMMPAVDAQTGRILRTSPDQIALSPNGHGGTLDALHRGGHLRRLQDNGVDTLFYFQVDNPLVKVADPIFLGLHRTHDAELSTKVVRKTDPEERIGLVVHRGGRSGVVEYTEIKKEDAMRRADDGGLLYFAGSTAIHLFSVSFLMRLAEAQTILPYHRAHKCMSYLDEAGQIVKPTGPNAYKFEMFIFDAMPLARRVMTMETDRAEEFEPLKNAEGPYSPASVKQAIADRCARWLSQAGVRVATSGGRTPPLEISPLFAYDAEELRAKVAGMGEISAGTFLGPDFVPPRAATEDADTQGN